MKAILETIESNAHTITSYHYQQNTFGAPWHFHPQFELVYIVSGQGTRYVGNSIELFEKGDFVLIAGNVPHCWKNSSDYVGACHSIVVQWMPNAIKSLPEFNVFDGLVAKAKLGIHFSPDDPVHYETLMNNVVVNDPLLRVLNFLMLFSELKNEVNYRLLCDSEQEYKLSVVNNDRLNKVYLFIENHFDEKVTLKDIASEVNMGSESFSRFFSESMNKPFFSFLNEFRIKKACKMLSETNRSVSEICYSCGFESLPFFHKQFKKYKDTTPFRYRTSFLKAMT